MLSSLATRIARTNIGWLQDITFSKVTKLKNTQKQNVRAWHMTTANDKSKIWYKAGDEDNVNDDVAQSDS